MEVEFAAPYCPPDAAYFRYLGNLVRNASTEVAHRSLEEEAEVAKYMADLLASGYVVPPGDLPAIRDGLPEYAAWGAPESLQDDEFIIEKLLPAGELATLVASGGSYKTMLVALLAVHVAAGKALVTSNETLDVKQSNVLIVGAEDRAGRYMRRLYAAATLLGVSHEVLRKRVSVLDMSSIDARVTTRTMGTNVGTGLAEKITARAKSLGARCIIFETASRLNGIDESNEGMAVLARQLELVARNANAAVLVSHHVAKAVSRDRTMDQHSARGGGSFTDNCRSALQMQRDATVPTQVELQHVKFNLSGGMAPSYYRMVETSCRGWPALQVILPADINTKRENDRREMRDTILGVVGRIPSVSERRARDESFEELRGRATRQAIEEAIAALIACGDVERYDLGKPIGSQKTALRCSAKLFHSDIQAHAGME